MTATSSGEPPPGSPGPRSSSSTAKLTPRPASAARPRQRPNATIGERERRREPEQRRSSRWWSTSAHASPSGDLDRTSCTASPSETSGAPGPLGSGVATCSPRAAPSVTRTTAVPQPFTFPAGGSAPSTGSGHASRSTALTVPGTCCCDWPAGDRPVSPGQSQAIPASVTTASGTTTTRAAYLARLDSGPDRRAWWAPMGRRRLLGQRLTVMSASSRSDASRSWATLPCSWATACCSSCDLTSAYGGIFCCACWPAAACCFLACW